MQIIEEIQKKLKEKGVSVLKLSKETGISPYKIYKWIDKKSKPRYEDKVILEKWLISDLENVLTGKVEHTEAAPNSGTHINKYIALLEKQNEISLAEIKQNLKQFQEELAHAKNLLIANQGFLSALYEHLIKDESVDKSLREQNKNNLKMGK